MRMRWRRCVFVLALGFQAYLGPTGAKATIIVTDWRLTTTAAESHDPASADVVKHETVTFPFQEIHSTVSGPTSAEAAFDFHLGDNNASFNISFDLARSPGESSAFSWGRIRFLATEELGYTIAGGLDMMGTGTLALVVHLAEAAYPNPFLYGGSHGSLATPDESFTLGQPGGDLGWYELGGLSGTVMPFVGYELFYQYDLRNFPVTDSVATADGDLSFVLIPEPSSLAALLLGGLLLRRKRIKGFPVMALALAAHAAMFADIAKASIIVTDWTLRTSAADNPDPSSFDIIQHETVTFPFNEKHIAVSGRTSVESDYNFTLNGKLATFDFDFLLTRSASESRSVTSGRIRFFTTEPLDYEIAGGLVMTGTGTLVLHAHLVEAAYPNATLYLGDHVGRQPNQSFTLGIPGGDLGWTEAGSLSGTVMPYVGYEFYYQYDLQHYPVTDTVASAQGDLGFVLTPEPSALLPLLMGGTLLMRKRR